LEIYMAKLKGLGLAAALALLSGCRGGNAGPEERGTAPTSPTHVVYSIDNDRDTLSTFWTDADGRLYPHNPSGGPLPTPPNPLDLAIDRSADRLYSIGGYSSNFKVGLFNLGLDGTPTVAGAPAWPMSSPPGAQNLTFVPSSRFVFLSDTYNRVIVGYKVQADGTLVRNDAGGVPISTGARPVHLAVDPEGKTLYVANQDGGSISVFRIGADGSLSTLQAAVPAGINPEKIVVR